MLEMTKENKDIIHAIIVNIDEDLHNLLSTYGFSSIKVPINYDKEDKDLDYSFHLFNYEWSLDITSNCIYIRDRNDDNHWLRIANENGLFTATNDEFIPCLYVFIKNYFSGNRDLIIQELERKEELRKKSTLGLESLLQKSRRLKTGSIVKIDIPATNNRHEIELIKEEGRSIGTIDFGDRTIQLITKGDIVLVPIDKENTHQKKLGTQN